MELPLFPLHTVLFPGRPLPLHIFEPRYRALVRDCLHRDRRFGVIAIRTGREVADEPEIFTVGTVAEIEDVQTLADGRCNIVTRGLRRFRVRRVLPAAPYLRAEADLLGEQLPATEPDSDLLRSMLVPYLAGLGAPHELLDRLPASCTELAWLAASAIQVDLTDQQRLLEMDSTADRVDATIRILRREHGLMRHLGSVGSLRPPGPNGADLN